MTDHRTIFVVVLRAALVGDGALLSEVTADVGAMAWRAVLAEARRQAVAGVMWRGVERLRPSSMPRAVMLEWYAEAGRTRAVSAANARAAVEVERLARTAGLSACLLKGQVSASRYPDPALRTPGDVDMWVWADGRTASCGTLRATMDAIRALWPATRFAYHHAEVGSVAGVEAELHYRPAYRCNPLHNRRLQRWLREQRGVAVRRHALPEGEVTATTDAFDRVYQMAHIAAHILREGIGLRQLVDYYCLLRRGCSDVERRETARLLRRFGLTTTASAVMHVLAEVVALPSEQMVVPPDARRGRWLMDEVWRGGNFGQHGGEAGGSVRLSWAGRNWRRLCRDARMLTLFPAEALFEPAFRIYHFAWRALAQMTVAAPSHGWLKGVDEQNNR